jgi:hypothetical protein
MPKLINNWDELKDCTSETHILEIDPQYHNGWIRPKVPDTNNAIYDTHYLSTHTFYGGHHEYSTKLLQECGFDVELANWDAPKEKP